MLYYVLVFTLNLVFNIFKTLEINYTYDRKLTALMWNTVWLALVSLFVFYLSLDRLFQGDYLVAVFYIGGSVAGKVVTLKYLDKPKNEQTK